MQKLLSIFIYLLMLIFIESAAEVTGVPASAPAEISAEPKYVALTFDDGPRRDTTARLLDGLRQRGASATFFLVGERLAGNEDLVLRMQREGHQIGNHTYSHIRLDGSDAAGQLADIEEAQRAICGILGTESCWLRPPYGLVAPTVQAGITVPMVHWSVDPRDWESRNTDKVVRAVLEAVQPGDIILLHDIYSTSVDAASDRGHAGGAGVLACYGGGAADPWRNSTAGRSAVPLRRKMTQYCRTTATTLPRI